MYSDFCLCCLTSSFLLKGVRWRINCRNVVKCNWNITDLTVETLCKQSKQTPKVLLYFYSSSITSLILIKITVCFETNRLPECTSFRAWHRKCCQTNENYFYVTVVKSIGKKINNQSINQQNKI